jgi:hypothetical protein
MIEDSSSDNSDSDQEELQVKTGFFSEFSSTAFSPMTQRRIIFQTLITGLADMVIIGVFLGILGAYYYCDKKSKLFWKIGLSLDLLLLIF